MYIFVHSMTGSQQKLSRYVRNTSVYCNLHNDRALTHIRLR